MEGGEGKGEERRREGEKGLLEEEEERKGGRCRQRRHKSVLIKGKCGDQENEEGVSNEKKKGRDQTNRCYKGKMDGTEMRPFSFHTTTALLRLLL